MNRALLILALIPIATRTASHPEGPVNHGELTHDVWPLAKKNNWHEGDIEGYISSKKSDIRAHLKAWHHYIPENAIDHALIVLIHGTGAANAGWYSKKGHAHFEGFLTFAQAHAENTKSIVDCISFGWTGNNTIEDRIGAAKDLATFINIVSERYGSITLVGHSHGSNVALAASQSLESPVDLILLATPIRTGNETIDPREGLFSPGKRVASIYNIYSPIDILQQLGSIRSGIKPADLFAMAHSIIAPGSSRKIAHSVNNSYNIQISLDGIEPGHKEIRRVAPHIAPLIAAIKKSGKTTGNFDAAIESSSNSVSISEHISLKDLGFTQRISWQAYRFVSMLAASMRDFTSGPLHCEKADVSIP